MRAFVTGGAGFVGQHLRRLLLSCGDVDVTPPHRVDITDGEALRTAIGETRPDVIFHLAGRTSVAGSWEDQLGYRQVNGEGTRNVLAAAASAAREALTIVVSSSEVYADAGDADLTETSPIAPRTPYGVSKWEAEEAAMDAMQRGQRVIIVRPFAHIGPGQGPNFFVPSLVRRLRQTTSDHVPVGNLALHRDISDVRDVVRAYRLVAVGGVVGETYNVGTGTTVLLADLADHLREFLTPEAQFVASGDLQRSNEPVVVRASIEKLRHATGFTPEIPLAATLNAIVAAPLEYL